MTKGQHAYELRTLRGARMTWAEIATFISSTEEGARRVAKHHARTHGLPLPERYGDGTRREASVLAERLEDREAPALVAELADELGVSRERIADLARRHARANNLPFPRSLAHPAITSPTAPADAYRMGVTNRDPWATVARTLGYRDGKSAQTIAREHATANGLHYPFTYRGPGRRTMPAP